MGTNINKKIAVIGGSGFLGKSLLKLLLNENAEIILFTRKKNYKKNLNKIFPDNNIKCIQWNINNLSLIEENIKTSMKERNKEKTLTLRMAISEFKKEEIDKQVDLTNEDSIRIIQRMIKQRKESMSQFIDAGRKELADKEEAEITILKEFLPEQLSEEEITSIVLEVISETGSTEPADMGKVMGALKSKIQGNADMGLVSKIVKENLSA